MNPFTQKSIFLWNVPAVQNGDAQKIADTLRAGGFGAVWVKVADGLNVFYSGLWNTLTSRPNVSRAFVDTMHANGIAVAGWGFCYGTGDNEGKIAAQQVNALGLDGYIFDIESKFETYSDRVQRAGQMIGTYNKNVLPFVPVGICSWAFFWARSTGSQIHAPEHIKFLMDYADYGIPMIYWNRLDSNNKPAIMSDAQVLGDLEISTRQWKKITAKHIIPVGRAYTGDGNVVTSGNVDAFGLSCAFDYFGYSFWSLEHAIKMPDVWATLVSLPSHGTAPEPPPIEPPPPATHTVTLELTPPPTVVTYAKIGVDDVYTFITFTPAPVVVPPPPVVTPETFPAKYRICDDIENNRDPIRHGLPSTERLRGGKGTVNLSSYPKWMDYIYQIQGNPAYQFDTTTKLFKRAPSGGVGWSNAGGYVVEQVVFSGNILEVTRIEGNKAFIKSVLITDVPPAVLVKPVGGTHALIHNFSIQYTDHLDMDTNGQFARTIVFSNPGEELYIDLTEYKLVRL